MLPHQMSDIWEPRSRRERAGQGVAYVLLDSARTATGVSADMQSGRDVSSHDIRPVPKDDVHRHLPTDGVELRHGLERALCVAVHRLGPVSTGPHTHDGRRTASCSRVHASVTPAYGAIARDTATPTTKSASLRGARVSVSAGRGGGRAH